MCTRLTAAAALLLAGGAAAAQAPGPPVGTSTAIPFPAPMVRGTAPGLEVDVAGASRLPEAFRTPAGAFAASLVVPGTGQAALGLRRWPVYLAVEAGFWWLWADARGDFHGYRASYRDLAWESARIQEGSRQDGGWSYYEAMSQYPASGAFDGAAAPGIQPEEDPATYNGSVWAIARGIYLPGGIADPGTPEHDAALAWYEARAAGPGFLWSWAGQDAELARFRALIASADGARRTQTTALGVILANHLVSAIDALIAARLDGPGRPVLDSGAVDGPMGGAWRLRVRLPLPDGHEHDG